MTVDKKRVSVMLTKIYRKSLDSLIEKGIYLEYQEAIRDALRMLFGALGISPFYPRSLITDMREISRIDKEEIDLAPNEYMYCFINKDERHIFVANEMFRSKDGITWEKMEVES